MSKTIERSALLRRAPGALEIGTGCDSRVLVNGNGSQNDLLPFGDRAVRPSFAYCQDYAQKPEAE
jgi:hypothetical protein